MRGFYAGMALCWGIQTIRNLISMITHHDRTGFYVAFMLLGSATFGAAVHYTLKAAKGKEPV